jgi:kynurenine formamidase
VAREMTTETGSAIEAMADECRNWEKWGSDDEIGALNYVTADKVASAARLVQRGQSFSLAMPLGRWGPQDPKSAEGAWRSNPMLILAFDGAFTAEEIEMAPQGIGWTDDVATLFLQAGTHWDALAHCFDRGQMWNGYTREHVSWLGAERNGIQNWSSRIVTRGVLLDIARSKKLEHLEPGYAITEEDLEGCIGSQGPTSVVRTGDIVLIRTGQLGSCRENGWGDYAGGDAPGLSFFTAPWLHHSEIAGVASDTWGVEVRPNELAEADQPLHQIMIPNIGLIVGENFVLDDLAQDCADDGIYEFLFIGAPAPFTGSVSGLANPQAVK